MICKKLATGTVLDQVLCVCPGRRPIESCTEGLANKGPSCGVVPAKTGMNLSQELPPLLEDTSLKDSGNAFLIELPVVDLVGLRTPDNTASLVLIFWELLPMKVGQEWFGPRGNYYHDEVGRWYYFGG